MYIRKITLKQKSLSYIRFFVSIICVHIYHVAHSEVWKKVCALIRNAECYRIIPVEVIAFLLVYYSQVGIYVSSLFFLCQWHIPQIGNAIAYTFLRTDFTCQLLPINKCHHSVEVCLLKT